MFVCHASGWRSHGFVPVHHKARRDVNRAGSCQGPASSLSLSFRNGSLSPIKKDAVHTAVIRDYMYL